MWLWMKYEISHLNLYGLPLLTPSALLSNFLFDQLLPVGYLVLDLRTHLMKDLQFVLSNGSQTLTIDSRENKVSLVESVGAAACQTNVVAALSLKLFVLLHYFLLEFF